MTNSVNALKKSLTAMTAQDRNKAETQLLADYARHAAFERPVDAIGPVSLYAVAAGLEEAALTKDEDIHSVITEEELQRAIESRTMRLILIPSHAKLSDALITYLCERGVYEKTIFISR